ncbi:MAG TPA: hypothetical protein VJR47_21660 [Stellaceae bacterium]|nr:hypothetical protein [Stellaceae bacterium]
MNRIVLAALAGAFLAAAGAALAQQTDFSKVAGSRCRRRPIAIG